MALNTCSRVPFPFQFCLCFVQKVGGQVEKGHSSHPVFPSSLISPQSERNLLEVAQVCSENTDQRLSSWHLCPSKNTELNTQVPFLMFHQRQMSQQNRDSRKARFDNCTRVHGKHLNMVGESIHSQSFSCWRTSLRSKWYVLQYQEDPSYRGRTWDIWKKWRKSSRISLNRNEFLDKGKTFMK